LLPGSPRQQNSESVRMRHLSAPGWRHLVRASSGALAQRRPYRSAALRVQVTRKIAALSGAWLCLSVVYFIGLTFFGHLYAAEARGGQPLVPGLVGFAISNALRVLVFSWLADQLGHAF